MRSGKKMSESNKTVIRVVETVTYRNVGFNGTLIKCVRKLVVNPTHIIAYCRMFLESRI